MPPDALIIMHRVSLLSRPRLLTTCLLNDSRVRCQLGLNAAQS